MSKLYAGVISLVILVVVLGYQNCGVKTPVGDSATGGASTAISVTGTVSKSTPANPLIDGCKILVCSFDNLLQKKVCFIPVKYDPSQLNDGDTVTLKGIIRTDMATNCMAGEIIQVEKVDLVSPSPSPSLPPSP